MNNLKKYVIINIQRVAMIGVSPVVATRYFYLRKETEYEKKGRILSI